MGPPPPKLAALAAALTLVGLACGPSFQVVYEGDARFEHCYALDDSPNVSMQAKTDCWSQWLQRYTYGQTRDRADYAAMRAAALQEVHALPTDEAIMGAAPGGGTHGVAVNEPAPTNAFTSPPKTMADVDGGHDLSTTPPETIPAAAPSAPLPVMAAPVAPKDDCVGGCRTMWQACKGPCKGATCTKCDKGYGGCVKACF